MEIGRVWAGEEEKEVAYRLSLSCVRTSFRYVFRMLSTLKT